jgi:hypothetical protein
VRQLSIRSNWKLQFFHRSQVQPIQGAAMFAAAVPVLGQCRLEHQRRQGAKLEGRQVPRHTKPRLGTAELPG